MRTQSMVTTESSEETRPASVLVRPEGTRAKAGVPAGLREELFQPTQAERINPARGLLTGLLLGGFGWAALALLLRQL